MATPTASDRARYAFHLDTDFAPSGAEPETATPLTAPARHWDGVLHTVETRQHPDSSTSQTVWFESLSSWTGAASPPPEPPAAALTGLAVVLRAFDDREILAIEHLDRWAGAPRLGDTLLPLWLALSPEIPDLDPGVPLRRHSNLPLLLRNGSGLVLALDLHWTLLEQDQPEGLPPAWHLRCEGSTSAEGRDRAGDWVAKEHIEGQVKADLWVSVESHEVVLADFDWELALSARVAGVADGASRGVVAQHQHHRGSLRRLPPPTTPLPPWAPPVPQPYRAPAQVHQVFEAAGPALSACLAQATPPPEPWVAQLSVILFPDGRVTGTEVSAKDPWAGGERCVQDTACGLSFPPSAEPAERWGYTVAWAQGAVQPYPNIAAPERTRGPLFFAPPTPPPQEQGDEAGGIFPRVPEAPATLPALFTCPRQAPTPAPAP